MCVGTIFRYNRVPLLDVIEMTLSLIFSLSYWVFKLRVICGNNLLARCPIVRKFNSTHFLPIEYSWFESPRWNCYHVLRYFNFSIILIILVWRIAHIMISEKERTGAFRPQLICKVIKRTTYSVFSGRLPKETASLVVCREIKGHWFAIYKGSQYSLIFFVLFFPR